ncbi:hypothetical protein DL93DRAFT_2081789, partial [Clavulina sp. PMI_390]
MLTMHQVEPQFQWPDLNEHYDMVTMNFIGSDDSECKNYATPKYVARHDTWVDAALVARVVQELRLPPFHIFAAQN